MSIAILNYMHIEYLSLFFISLFLRLLLFIFVFWILVKVFEKNDRDTNKVIYKKSDEMSHNSYQRRVNFSENHSKFCCFAAVFVE